MSYPVAAPAENQPVVQEPPRPEPPVATQPVVTPQVAIPPLGGGFSLEALAKDLARKEAESPVVKEQKTPLNFELDPAIDVPLADFQHQLDAYIDRLKAANKMNLASALSQAAHQLTHNRWECKVPNPLQKELIERDPELMPFLRQRLHQPVFFIQVEVDRTLQPPEEATPYTEEDKLKELAKDVPALQKFQRLFKTRILYE